MEKDKSRGIKHIKDKRKYKGNSVKNAKYVPPKSKPNLGTNWDRYDSEEENEHEQKLSSSTDFSLLSNVPISAGSHFQFKNDRIEEHIAEKPNLFCLDLDLLQRSILTIPFYERLGIDKKYFTGDEIDTMNNEAKKNISSYNEFIQKKETEESTVPELTIIDKLSEDLQDNVNISSSEEDDMMKLIDSCNIHSDDSKVTTDSKIKAKDKSEQDLEEWLEDILED